jgi:hypothetical protein
MIVIPVHTTTYTVTAHGRIAKFVACENCPVEYVYVLEREASGAGTTFYGLNEEDAQDDASSASQDTLKAVLENDFDAVPCPVCGHYQRYMFPKLLETKGLGGVAVTLIVMMGGCLDAVAALYWSLDYLQRPNDYAFGRMVVTWSILLFLCLVGLGLALVKRRKIRRFDPNLEDQQTRIAKGRSRAMTRAEFDRTQREERESEARS